MEKLCKSLDKIYKIRSTLGTHKRVVFLFKNQNKILIFKSEFFAGSVIFSIYEFFILILINQ